MWGHFSQGKCASRVSTIVRRTKFPGRQHLGVTFVAIHCTVPTHMYGSKGHQNALFLSTTSFLQREGRFFAFATKRWKYDLYLPSHIAICLTISPPPFQAKIRLFLTNFQLSDCMAFSGTRNFCHFRKNDVSGKSQGSSCCAIGDVLNGDAKTFENKENTPAGGREISY
jgi:hypothetical protein